MSEFKAKIQKLLFDPDSTQATNTFLSEEILKSLRNPTPEMIRAGELLLDQPGRYEIDRRADQALKIWQAMIDQALRG